MNFTLRFLYRLANQFFLRLSLGLTILIMVGSQVKAQNDTIIIQEDIQFSVADKPMWGPGSDFTINQHFDIIPKKEFDVSLPFPPPKFSLLGGEFGFDIEASLYMSFGLGFYFKDFTTGSIDIDFPVDIEFDVPAFNAGDIARIETRFRVRDEAKITTRYPSAGRIGMTTDFAIKSRLAFGVCFYDCLSPFSLFEAVPLPDGLNTINPIQNGALVIDTTDPESLFSMPFDTLFQISQREGESFVLGLDRKPIFGGDGGLGVPSILCQCDANDNLPGIPSIERSYFDLLPFDLGTPTPAPLDCEAINERREMDDMQRKADSTQNEMDKIDLENDKAAADEDDANYDNASDEEKANIDKRREERDTRDKARKKNAYDRATRFLRALDAMDGFLNIPYVETSRPPGNLGSTTELIATGDSIYVDATFKVLKAMKQVPYVGLLNAKIIPPSPIDCLGSIEYSVFDIETNFAMTNQQKFSFYPTVLVKIDFAEALDYSVVHPDGNITAARSNSVTYETGSELNVKFPCDYDYLELKPTYSIQSGKSNFRNHTYDTYALGLTFKALSFNITLNSVTLIPAVCIPEICIPLIGCTPEFCTPEIKSPSFNETLGPVLDAPVPIASPSVDWFNQEWEIDGFQEIEGNPFRIAPTKFKLELLAENATCKDANDGNILISKQGGTEPISYTWSNGATTKDLSDVPAGSYFLTAIDKNGCPAYASIEITAPEELTADEEVTHINCFGENNGVINLDVKGGVAPYLYLWTNGSLSEDLEGLSAGTYDVEITDASGCVMTKSININESLPLQTGTLQANHPSCNDLSDGSIVLSVSGGEAPYTYEWSNGLTTKDPTGLPAETYSVTVTDKYGCGAIHEVTLTQPAIMVTDITVTSQNICYGESRGAFDLTVNGGVPPYTYQWYLGNQELNVKEENPDNLASGSYTVVVTDDNGCEVTTSNEIPLTDNRIASRIEAKDVSCYGGGDGAVFLSIDGGNADFVFNWNNGQTSEDLTNVAAGVYTVTITDSKGCSAENSAIVFEPLALEADYLVTNIRCEGDETGEIELFVGGGTSPYILDWLHGEDGAKLKNLAQGSYQVVITDNNDCSIMESMEVLTEPEPCITIPDAFTPNGDGANDQWVLRNINLSGIKIKVFNKWGQEVFSSTGYATPWDGSYNGKTLPSGTYYYILDQGDGNPPVNGSISIIK